MKKQSSHKYLITGGYGFIGSALIRELITNNNNTIINIDKLGYASNKNAIGSVRGNKNYHLNKIIAHHTYIRAYLLICFLKNNLIFFHFYQI